MNERNEPKIYDDYHPVFRYFDQLSKEELFPTAPITSNPFGDVYKRILQLPIYLRKIIIEAVNPDWSIVTFYQMMREIDKGPEGYKLIYKPLSEKEQQLIVEKTVETLYMFIDYLIKSYPIKK